MQPTAKQKLANPHEPAYANRSVEHQDGRADGTTNELSSESSADEEQPAGGFPVAAIVMGALALALFGWIGVRVQAATKKQSELAEERQQVAAAAVKGNATGPLATLRGTPDTWLPTVALDGTLAPVQESDLGFKAPGKLASVRVRIGQHVDRGDILATLDGAEGQASVQAAQAQVKVAEAQLVLASDSERRTTSLVGSGAAAQASGVQVAQQRALVAAQLEAAKAQLALVTATQFNNILSAPFSGTVTRVPSGPGGVVTPGVPLFHLQDTSRLKLVATVGEGDVSLVRAASGVTINAGGRTVHGKIVTVLGSVDSTTRRVPVEAQIDNASAPTARASANDKQAALTDEPLLAGIFVRGTAEAGQPVPVLRLPSSALRPGSQAEVMAVVAGKLVAKEIVFSTANDGTLLVRAGLSASDVLLATPSAEAKTGDAVETRPAPPQDR